MVNQDGRWLISEFNPVVEPTMSVALPLEMAASDPDRVVWSPTTSG